MQTVVRKQHSSSGSGSSSSSRSNRLDYVWWLSVITLVGLFIVNVAGFMDTETGSALGCGHEWPLCNGSVIPDVWGLRTIIEFAHRAIVGGVTILLLVTSVVAWKKYGGRLEVRVFILTAVGFVFVEALLGALGVLFSDPPAILAIHLGVSLMAFAGIVLLTIVLAQIQRAFAREHEAGSLDSQALGGNRSKSRLAHLRLRAGFLPRRFRFWSVFAAVYTFIALYIGAFIASIGAGASFRGFPFPTETLQQAGKNFYFDILHRSVALGLIVLCVVLFVSAYKVRADRPDLFRGASTAIFLVCLQGLSGGLLVYTHLSIPAFLLHVSVVSCLFATLGYLVLQSLPESERATH